MGDSHVGLQARLMSQALRKLSGAINKSKTIAIFINQIREKVGVMFGNPETTPGGRALKFYSSVRLEVRRAEQLKQGNDVMGNKTKIKVVKNKVRLSLTSWPKSSNKCCSKRKKRSQPKSWNLPERKKSSISCNR